MPYASPGLRFGGPFLEIIMKKICVYIDGFNLYHAIDKLKNNRLKWLDLSHLMSEFTDPHHQIIANIYFFTALPTWKKEALSRHKAYIRALETKNIHVILGKFKTKDRFCHDCGARWQGHEEKETDVNIALYLLNGAYRDEYDEAIIISQDSDLFPAILMVKDRFPEKKVKIITPPELSHSKEMAKVVGSQNLGSIKRIHLERSLFPEVVKNAKGYVVAIRPEKYD